ncbi:MAG: DNA polymerase III subunit gamma/tau, partial [Diaphorobacter sp.]|nr:DNA polymerase III subunit gamma/tau [Diaphorobacter sp.]
ALEEMTGILQRMAVLQAVPDRSAASGGDPDAAEIQRLAAQMPADETQLLYSLCLHGRVELGLAPDEYAALVMVLLRLLAFKPASAAVSPEKKTLKPAPEAVQAGVAPAVPASASPAPPVVASASPAKTPPAASLAERPRPPVPDMPEFDDVGDDPPWVDEPDESAPPAPAPALGPGPRVVAIPVRDPGPASPRLDVRRDAAMPGTDASRLHLTPEGDFWFETVQSLVKAEAVTALVRELALQSQLLKRSEGAWVLRIERETLAQGSTRERLTAALSSAGHEVRIAIESGPVTDSPALRLAAAAQQRQREAERLIMDDPFVQTMMRDFGGKIVPGTLKADPA